MSAPVSTDRGTAASRQQLGLNRTSQTSWFDAIEPKRSSGVFTRLAYGSHCRDGSVVSSLHGMNDPQPEGHMASYIGRREFLATLGGAAAAWPLAARAQQPAMPLIGFLRSSRAEGFSFMTQALWTGLGEKRLRRGP